jgi:hypothetical protein
VLARLPSVYWQGCQDFRLLLAILLFQGSVPMDFRLPKLDSIFAKTVGIFAAIGAVLGGADGATAADFKAAVIFAIVGGLIGAAVGIFVGK